MKHGLKITLILLSIFLLAQFIGIAVLYNYIDVDKSKTAGKTIFQELPIGERPPMDEQTSFIPVIIAVLIGTGILFLLIKYKVYFLWRLWFLMAVVLALLVSWAAFIKPAYALFLALAFGLWKIFRPNILVHNFTEVFIYGGLAAIFVPLFSLWSVSILLLLISVYDMYAVWKSKHMIVLAKSQAKAKVFAGLLIPYSIKGLVKKGIKKSKKITKKKEVKKSSKKVKTTNHKAHKGIKNIFEKKKTKLSKKELKNIRTAVLGGGDIGFPLIFTGVILAKMGLWQSLIIPIFSGAALLLLLLKGESKKFYPAMPFISGGCFLGLLVVWLFGLL
tara:strand:+ start:1067 stop:2062 length:996 start_codon:yes stop_codon:yes gene_type:complete